MAQEIKYESALPQLIQSLIGTQQKSSQTSSANTDALQQIFNQQAASSTPEGMEALIQEVFRVGAQKVPELTGAFANATGSRSSNNSGLALSLGELNKTLAGQAAGLVTAQQQAAAQTAAQIANATRGTNTTQTNGVNRGNAGVLGLAGTALNAADKLGLTKGLKGMIGGNAASAPLSFSGPGGIDAGGLAGLDSYDFQGAINPLTGMDSGASDLFSGFTDQFGDFGSGVVDSFGDFGSDFVDTLSDAGSSIGDFFSSFFADGGMVGRDRGTASYADGGQVASNPVLPNFQDDLENKLMEAHDGIISAAKAKASVLSKMYETKAGGQQAPGYADGGTVRNRNEMGGPISRGAGTSALTVRPSSSSSSARRDAAGMLEDELSRNNDGVNSVSEAGQVGTAAQNAAVVNGFGLTALGMVSPALAAALSMATQTPSLQSMAFRGIADAVKGSFGDQNPASTANATISNAMATQLGIDPMDALMGITDAFGTAAGSSPSDTGSDAGVGGGIGGSGNSAGGDAGTGNSDASGSTSAGGDAVAADGGLLQGPGTGISDSIPIKAADGEYVISKDVVDAIGVDFFDKLQQRYHTPAAVQRAAGVR